MQCAAAAVAAAPNCCTVLPCRCFSAPPQPKAAAADQQLNALLLQRLPQTLQDWLLQSPLPPICAAASAAVVAVAAAAAAASSSGVFCLSMHC